MDLNISPMIVTVVSTHFLALLSPGPDFLMIIKSSINNSKRKSIGVPFGIAMANAVYIIICILGLGEIILNMSFVINIIEFIGGIFFIYISMKALKSKKQNYNDIFSVENNSKYRKSFLISFINGFVSGISNPKNLIFYLGLFSIIITSETNNTLKITLGLWMVTIVFIWDSIILFLLSNKNIQKHFQKVIFYVDKVIGTILGILGIKLLSMAIL